MEVYVHTTVNILQKENKKFSSLGNKLTIIVKKEYFYTVYSMFFVCVASGDLVLSSCHCPISVLFQYSML